MPQNLPLLYELEITISSTVNNQFSVRSVLKEHGPYPPEPRREGNELVFPSQGKADEVAETLIPADLVRAATLPVVYPNVGHVGPITGSTSINSSKLNALADAVFQPPADELLDQLLSHAEPFTTAWPPSPALSRISFVLESELENEDAAILAQVPWEELRWRDQPLKQNCVILRRRLEKAGEKSGSFDLPLNVALVKAPPSLPMDQWGKDLFDHFTAEARDRDGIDWDDVSYGKVKLGEVHHVVFDSSSPDSLLLIDEGIQTLRANPTEGGPWSVAPRLLVLHDTSAFIPPNLGGALLVNSALAKGADAVLMVALPSPNANAGDFFPTFYRKLMHNWPLDQCVWAAKSIAQLNQMPADLIFGARTGGEFGLLLTRTLLEATLDRPVGARRRLLRSRGSATQPVKSKRRGQVVGLDSQLPPVRAGRASRVAAEMEDSLLRIAEDRRDKAFNVAAESASRITFDAEIDGVTELVKARRNSREAVREAAREINETEEMAADIAAAPAATVQKAMVRLTNLWITEDDSPGEPRVITAHDYLVSQQPYELHLQIGPLRADAIVAEHFNEESFRKVFEEVDRVILDVMFFSTDKDFALASDELEEASGGGEGHASQLEQIDGEEVRLRSERGRWGRRAELSLPRYGPSSELTIEITPQEPGLRRIRTCIYYRNVLLQSVLLEAEVAEAGTSPAERTSQERVITGRTTDYIASVDFALLNELPQPSLNLFSNQDPNGTHWIGAYSTGDTRAFQLVSGDMRVFDKGLLNINAERMREIFLNIEGAKNTYKLDAPLPLTEVDIKRREGYLRDLALRGWRLFHPLFVVSSDGADDDDNAQRLKNFKDKTAASHIISIARCGPESSTLPWAALYSNYLDTNKEEEIGLCGVFKQQLADNVWDGNTLKEKHDLLDDPEKCRSLPECPLNTAKRKLTVCPFGFWGFLHQVEQPLQQVKPTPVDEEPKALKNHNFGQTSFLTRAAEDPVKLAVGAYPGIPDAPNHKAEIEALPLTVKYQDDRDEVMLLLTAGGQHIYYFYCHGDLDETEKVFSLKLGPLSKPGYIESSNLTPDEIQWQTPKPLFIMNGCETMAVTPDVTHGFLNTLKALGASGVIGTEVKVWTQLARPFGLQLLKHLVNGMSVGEAFLEVRKHLLRQYNPLGLIYSYYSPATLHLHDPVSCTWCNTHKK